MAKKKSSKLKDTVRIIATVIFLLAILFIPAGTLNWPEAWLLLGLYFFVVGGCLIWLKKNDPELLKERRSVRKDVKTWDKKIIFTYTIFLLIMLVLAGLDAVRFRWSRVPLMWKAVGYFGFIPAVILGFWAFKQNTYLAQYVRIQKDRGHRVITTGPYEYVRHPMYVGVMLFILCAPLALASFYSFIPAFVIVVLFIIRTSLEDKTLLEELEGYQEYAKKVRYRLIPGIW
ncbi:MAG: isoprenylcysteine carboxylmethyltransferase family protein [Candidatus Aminicenantes bacterium]|nr:isoprenylcysteine carboxylmethyltransferase family protein [Candidatus Aminicenantes bacterium]